MVGAPPSQPNWAHLGQQLQHEHSDWSANEFSTLINAYPEQALAQMPDVPKWEKCRAVVRSGRYKNTHLTLIPEEGRQKLITALRKIGAANSPRLTRSQAAIGTAEVCSMASTVHEDMRAVTQRSEEQQLKILLNKFEAARIYAKQNKSTEMMKAAFVAYGQLEYFVGNLQDPLLADGIEFHVLYEELMAMTR